MLYFFRGFFQRYLIEQGEGLDVESSPSEDLLAELSPHVAHCVKRILSSMIPEYSMMERSAKGRTVLVLLLRYNVWNKIYHVMYHIFSNYS